MHTDNIKAEAVNLKLLIVQNKRGSSGLTFATLTFKDCWPIVFHDLKDIQQMCVCVCMETVTQSGGCFCFLIGLLAKVVKVCSL